jgi:hypothetical protein
MADSPDRRRRGFNGFWQRLGNPQFALDFTDSMVNIFWLAKCGTEQVLAWVKSRAWGNSSESFYEVCWPQTAAGGRLR